MAKRKRGKSKSRSRKASLVTGLIVLVIVGIFSTIADWFVHHPRAWLDEKESDLPAFVYNTLLWTGNRVGDTTDGLGLTGYDAVYEYDEEAPSGSPLFAGAPRRTDSKVPNDVRILDRGEFVVGWSPSLHHPLWCAYHVTKEAKFESGKRPNFTKDRAVDSPAPSAYDRSGYDRGHMVPNYAIITRYGAEEQKKTFLMSNISPQTPGLNRGVWRNVEHRIADLWTARYGEIWVIVGAIPGTTGETLSGTSIDVPDAFYQLIVAQEGMDVRAMAILLKQTDGREFAARHLISIDDLETLTGLDFLPDLPDFIQKPLEAELPTRLWPIRWQDLLKQILLRYN